MAYNQNYSQGSNDKVRFDLMEHIGVLAKKDNGWTKEVNIVAWNGGKAKVGITLFEEEAETLVKALAHRYGLRYTGSSPCQEVAQNTAAMEKQEEELPFDEAAAEQS